MRFFAPIAANPRQLVIGLGSNFPLTSAQFKRRDAAAVELQIFTGDQASATPFQLPDGWIVKFGCKAPGDFRGAAMVLSDEMGWRPADQVYVAWPSFGTFGLAAMFGGATKARRYGAAHTLTADDLGGVVTVDVSSSVALTVDAGLGTAAERIWIVAANHSITLAAGAGVTITDNATIAGGTMVMITRTGANAWTLGEAEVDSLNAVNLIGEFSWWDPAHPEAPTSVETFDVSVTNDVLRGDEGQPVDAATVGDYVLRSELSSSFVKVNEVQTFSGDEKAQARSNIGAIADVDVVKVTSQSLSPEQKGFARGNIAAASQTDLDTTNTAATALASTVALKASAASVTALSATVTTLTGNALKKTDTGLSDADKLLFRDNIGAAAAAGDSVITRLAAQWNAIGNSTSIHANGALHAITGTAAVRNVALLDTGHAITAISGTTFTSAGFPGSNGMVCQFSGTLIPAGVLAGTWYYIRDAASGSFSVAATLGGAAIAVSGAITALKVLLPVGTFYRHRRLGIVSAATAGSTAGTRHSALQWAVTSDKVLGGWQFASRFGVSDAAAVANARLFVGMVGTNAVLSNANPSALKNCIGVGADSGDANLSIIHNDGSGTAVKIDLGSDFPANTRNSAMIELVLRCNDDLTVTYKVTNLTTAITTQGNLATDLPMDLQLLAPQHWRNNGATALAVALDVVMWKLEQRA